MPTIRSTEGTDTTTHHNQEHALLTRPGTSRDTSSESLSAQFHRWLVSGRCQRQSGAFVAWRDGRTGVNAFEYPEITGYALTYLAGRPILDSDETTAGREAAEWLTSRLHAGNYAAHDGWDRGTVYLFDLAMIATGLLTFGERVNEERYVTSGLDLTRKLIGELQGSEGPRTLSRSTPTTNRKSNWSTDGQAHMCKAVQCLLHAARLGVTGATTVAERLVRHTIGLQAEDGRFKTQQSTDITMLHPHIYAIEGLWIWGMARGDERALAHARRGMTWLWTRQLEHGGFPRLTTSPGSSSKADAEEQAEEQMDVTCQAIRMAMALHAETPGITRASQRLAHVAQQDGPDCAALPYQPASEHCHLNVWATFFGAQATEAVSVGAQSLTWQHLV